jgi:hypothetical protein
MSDVATAQAGTGNAAATSDAGKATDTASIIGGAGGADKGVAASGEPAKGADAAPAKDGAGDTEIAAWRLQMAGEDKAALKQLERYSSPADVWKKAKALEAKLSSGEFKRDLPDNASDEEKATWRKENGIPDKPEGYVEKITLPKGLVLGEADKPLATEFAAAAAEANLTPAQYSRMVAQYYAIQDKVKVHQEEADAAFHDEATEKLREEWGADYKRNVNAVNNLVAAMPPSLSGRLLSGRTADGRKIANDPEMIAWLSSMARELNPAATLVPAGTSDAGKSVAARIADIETLMKDRSGEYYRGPKSAALQTEYRELITARETMKARAA